LGSAPIVETKDGRSHVCQAKSWGSTIGNGLGEGVHKLSMLP